MNRILVHFAISEFFWCPLLSQLEADQTNTAADDDEEEEDEDEEASEDGEEMSPGDLDNDVSKAARAKQLAEHLTTIVQKILRDLGRILAVSLLALAGMICGSSY